MIVAFVTCTCLVGCGDSVSLILRDLVTTTNEIADTISRIPDNDDYDEPAEDFVKIKVPKFKKKFEGITHRAEVYNVPDKDQKKEMMAAAAYWLPELKATMDRGKKEMDRIDLIIYRVARDEADKKNNPAQGRYAEVGSKAANAARIDAYAQQGKTLIIVDPAETAPNLHAVKKAYTDLLKTLSDGFNKADKAGGR
jgi:hypothetical protein